MGTVHELHPRLNAEVREALQAPEVVTEFRIIYRRKSLWQAAHEWFFTVVLMGLCSFVALWAAEFISLLVFPK